MSQCCFTEPWIGRCTESSDLGSICCTKHTAEKCSVCGEQATTRCQASIGLMCGFPLCHLCGQGEMCLQHSGRGPVAIIRWLLGGGPVPSVFADARIYQQEIDYMEPVIAGLRKRGEWFAKSYDALKDKLAEVAAETGPQSGREDVTR